MNNTIEVRLPQGWTAAESAEMDGAGYESVHYEARQQGPKGASIDIYVGMMPEDETAEDQAYSNYAETVGFDDDDPEDFQPVFKLKFNGKNAWGFDAWCEDERPMRFLSQEARKGVLAVIYLVAEDASALDQLHLYLERNLRIR